MKQCLIDTQGLVQLWLPEQIVADHASGHSIMDRGGTHRAPPLTEELLAGEDY